MKNKVEVKIDVAVVCNDCALNECCPLPKQHVPIICVPKWKNGCGTVTVYCHVKKGGEQ